MTSLTVINSLHNTTIEEKLKSMDVTDWSKSTDGSHMSIMK